MKRTTIFLTEDQFKSLKNLGRPDGLKPSALIRIFVNEGLARRAQAARALKAGN